MKLMLKKQKKIGRCLCKNLVTRAILRIFTMLMQLSITVKIKVMTLDFTLEELNLIKVSVLTHTWNDNDVVSESVLDKVSKPIKLATINK